MQVLEFLHFSVFGKAFLSFSLTLSLSFSTPPEKNFGCWVNFRFVNLIATGFCEKRAITFIPCSGTILIIIHNVTHICASKHRTYTQRHTHFRHTNAIDEKNKSKERWEKKLLMVFWFEAISIPPAKYGLGFFVDNGKCAQTRQKSVPKKSNC